jgi:hypothetical protein
MRDEAMSLLLKLMKCLIAGWGEISGEGWAAGGEIVGREQRIVRRDGGLHASNGRSQKRQYVGGYARDRPLTRDMADRAGGSRGRQCLDLLHACGTRRSGSERVEFVMMKLQDEAKVDLGQQRQPCESTQAVSCAQTHQNPQ